MRPGLRSVAALLLAAGLATACAPSGPPPARYALVYGVSIYADAFGEGAGPVNLTYPDDDARALATLLEGQGYVVTLRENADASKARLEEDLAGLATTMGADDLLLVYFSGHGGDFAFFGLDPADYPQVPADTRWIFPYGGVNPEVTGSYLSSADFRLEDAVYDRELETMLEVVPATRKVVILDTCNSGGFVGSGADVDALPPQIHGADFPNRGEILSLALAAYAGYTGVGPGGAYVLSAAGADEESYETVYLGHGVFTYFLLEASQEGDLNRDGYITVLEAYAWASAAIETGWNVGAVSDFHPHLSGGAVDFVLFETP